jgi:uncharacterized protein YbjQ (UPF0145 family)
MSNYGQQPPYGQNLGNYPAAGPYGQQQPGPYSQPQQPYGQPSAARQPQQPYPGQQGPYGQQPGQYPPQSWQQPTQWTPQPPALKQPALVPRALPVVTMEKVPGRDIAEVIGDVVGVVARTRELRPDLRGGNPIDGYVVMLTDSRQDAVARMVEMAVAAGADAVVGLRFDCSEITQSLSEVAAYGTAVRLAAATDDGNQASDDQAAAEEEGGGELGDDETIRNWPPNWPSSEPQQPSSAPEDQR